MEAFRAPASGLRRTGPTRGEPFSLTASLIAAALMALLVLVFIWAQGRYEAG